MFSPDFVRVYWIGKKVEKNHYCPVDFSGNLGKTHE